MVNPDHCYSSATPIACAATRQCRGGCLAAVSRRCRRSVAANSSLFWESLYPILAYPVLLLSQILSVLLPHGMVCLKVLKSPCCRARARRGRTSPGSSEGCVYIYIYICICVFTCNTHVSPPPTITRSGNGRPRAQRPRLLGGHVGSLKGRYRGCCGGCPKSFRPRPRCPRSYLAHPTI